MRVLTIASILALLIVSGACQKERPKPPPDYGYLPGPGDAGGTAARDSGPIEIVGEGIGVPPNPAEHRLPEWPPFTEASGDGLPGSGAGNDVERRIQALTAARVSARAELLAKVGRYYVDERTTLSGLALQSKDVNYAVRGWLSGSEVVSEDWDSESGLATVKVRVRNAPIRSQLKGRLGGNLEDPAVARAYAEESARTGARADVLRQLRGQHVTSNTTVQNLMLSDQTVQTTVEGWLDRVDFDPPRWDGNVARVRGRLHVSREELRRLGGR